MGFVIDEGSKKKVRRDLYNSREWVVSFVGVVGETLGRSKQIL